MRALQAVVLLGYLQQSTQTATQTQKRSRTVFRVQKHSPTKHQNGVPILRHPRENRQICVSLSLLDPNVRGPASPAEASTRGSGPDVLPRRRPQRGSPGSWTRRPPKPSTPPPRWPAVAPRPPAAPRRRLVLLQCPAAEDPRGPPPHPRWLRAARPEATAERRSSSSMTGPGPSSSMAGTTRRGRGGASAARSSHRGGARPALPGRPRTTTARWARGR